MTTINTMREFLERLIATENLDAEIKEYAIVELDKMNARNERRKNTLTPRQRENEETKKTILKLLEDNNIKDVTQISVDINTSVQKAAALLRQLVLEEKINVKKESIDGKKKKVYFIGGGAETMED